MPVDGSPDAHVVLDVDNDRVTVVGLDGGAGVLTCTKKYGLVSIRKDKHFRSPFTTSMGR